LQQYPPGARIRTFELVTVADNRADGILSELPRAFKRLGLPGA
jgi:hypothetical protein